MTAGYYLGMFIVVAAVVIYMYPPALLIAFICSLFFVFKTRFIAIKNRLTGRLKSKRHLS
jgi:hypothetical protein